MKNILCFGDSNTFGTNPEGGRHGREVRWPGRLQKLLGDDWYVIEEGMGGRTTVWDDPLEPNRRGIAALPIALTSHRPLDLVISSLGTNDCKAFFHASPKVIARGAEALCKLVLNFDYGPWAQVPRILLVSPIYIGDRIETSPYVSFDSESPEKSRCLGPLYEEIARQYGCLFLDGAKVAGPSELDQLHMDGENHRAMADAIYEIIKRGLQ